MADNNPENNTLDSPRRLTTGQLCGQDERALIACPWGSSGLHRALVEPLQAVAQAAERAGFALGVASAYRSFERQCAIWNAKAGGARPVLDAQGKPVEVAALNETALLHAILRWSALPGTSRHHWGTDVDVFDASALAPGQAVQLTREECAPGGPFAAFHDWLDGYLTSDQNPGFYRPYDRDRGGVSPEPWHLSYAPVANQYARVLTPELVAQILRNEHFALKATVMGCLPDLFNRYVAVPMGPEPRL